MIKKLDFKMRDGKPCLIIHMTPSTPKNSVRSLEPFNLISLIGQIFSYLLFFCWGGGGGGWQGEGFIPSISHNYK